MHAVAPATQHMLPVQLSFMSSHEADVPATQRPGEVKQHWLPVHVSNGGSSQDAELPSTQALAFSTQHLAPVQFSPGLSQDADVPATQRPREVKQHWLPVHVSNGGSSQEALVPSTQALASTTQQ